MRGQSSRLFYFAYYLKSFEKTPYTRKDLCVGSFRVLHTLESLISFSYRFRYASPVAKVILSAPQISKQEVFKASFNLISLVRLLGSLLDRLR